MIETVEPPFSGQASEGHVFLAVPKAGCERRTPNTGHNNYNVITKPEENKSKRGWPQRLQRAASLISTHSDLWAVLASQGLRRQQQGSFLRGLVVAESYD